MNFDKRTCAHALYVFYMNKKLLIRKKRENCKKLGLHNICLHKYYHWPSNTKSSFLCIFYAKELSFNLIETKYFISILSFALANKKYKVHALCMCVCCVFCMWFKEKKKEKATTTNCNGCEPNLNAFTRFVYIFI